MKQADVDTVGCLEKLLEEAKAGDFSGFAIVMLRDGQVIETMWAGQCRHYLALTHSGAHLLARELEDSIRGIPAAS